MPTIAALSVLASCYGQLTVALRRQYGILKRVRATPMPAWAYFAGLLAHCVLVSFIDIALICTVGHLYGVPFLSNWLAVGALIGSLALHAGPDWKQLVVVAAWGCAGTVVGIWRFRWTPRSE